MPFYFEASNKFLVPIANIQCTLKIQHCQVNVLDTFKYNNEEHSTEKVLIEFIEKHNREVPNSKDEIKKAVAQIIKEEHLLSLYDNFINFLIKEAELYVHNYLIEKKYNIVTIIPTKKEELDSITYTVIDEDVESVYPASIYQPFVDYAINNLVKQHIKQITQHGNIKHKKTNYMILYDDFLSEMCYYDSL